MTWVITYLVSRNNVMDHCIRVSQCELGERYIWLIRQRIVNKAKRFQLSPSNVQISKVVKQINLESIK